MGTKNAVLVFGEQFLKNFILKKYCQVSKDLDGIPELSLLTCIYRTIFTDRLTVLKQDSSNVQANAPAWESGIAQIISFLTAKCVLIFTLLQYDLSFTIDYCESSQCQVLCKSDLTTFATPPILPLAPLVPRFYLFSKIILLFNFVDFFIPRAQFSHFWSFCGTKRKVRMWKQSN